MSEHYGRLSVKISLPQHLMPFRRIWQILTRPQGRKTKIFRSRGAKIVQNSLGAVRFFNLERQNWLKTTRGGPICQCSCWMPFICQFSDSPVSFIWYRPCPGIKRTLQTIVSSSIPLCALKYHLKVAVTKGAKICFSSPIKAVIDMCVKKEK